MQWKIQYKSIMAGLSCLVENAQVSNRTIMTLEYIKIFKGHNGHKVNIF